MPGLHDENIDLRIQLEIQRQELLAARAVVEAARYYLDSYLKEFPDTSDNAPEDILRDPLMAYDKVRAKRDEEGRAK